VAETSVTAFDTIDVNLALEQMRDASRLSEMLVHKWSHRPTLNTRTGKMEVVDWLNAERVAGWELPRLTSDKAKAKMAMLLENQSLFQRQKEAPVSNGRVLMQDTADADLALPTKYSLPIVRRMYALIIEQDWLVTQPLPGPTGYVFWMDFIRESDSTNILSVEYNNFLTAELGIPTKGKLSLNRATLTVLKQLMGTTWSLEGMEDARAQLGLDLEQELIGAWTEEFVRNLFGRHIKDVSTNALSGTATGQSLVAPWAGPNTLTSIAARGTNTITDYKGIVYGTVVDADTLFQKANRYPSDGIICGYGLAGFLQKLNTATQSQAPTDQNMGSLGITDYGTYAGRWRIWGTDFMPDDTGFLYKRNPSQLQASYVYAPYVPIQVMPAIYGDYNTSTGAYTNQDAYTRNIRERSAQICTKPYGFMPIKGPGGLTF
jgi:hypothetical protein